MGLSPGDYYLRLVRGYVGDGSQVPRYFDIRNRLVSVTQNTVLDLPLPVVILSGMVTDAVGNPVAGATVLVNQDFSSGGIYYYYNTWVLTDATGHYTMAILAGPLNAITLYPPTGSTLPVTTITVGTTISGDTVKDLQFQVAATLSGQVMDGKGHAVAGVQVWLTPKLGGATTTVYTDSSGNFSVGLSPGDYYLSLYGGGDGTQVPKYFAFLNRLISVTPNTVLDLPLPVVILSGMVTDAVGNPVAGATVLVNQDFSSGGIYYYYNTWVLTDATGHYTMAILAGPLNAITLYPPSGSSLPVATLSIGKTLTADWSLHIVYASGSGAYIAQADLAISKTVSPNPVEKGANVSYSITVANNGPDVSTSVTVTDSLPAETTYVSSSATGRGVVGGSGNNRTVTFTSLAAGASATITIVANVNSSTASGTQISNTAAVSSTTTDPNSNNNTATAVTTVAANQPPLANAGPDQTVSVGNNCQNGDKVKITQAPGVTPNSKPMAGVIVAHIQLKGDAQVFAVDTAGNASALCACLVPPPPK